MRRWHLVAVAAATIAVGQFAVWRFASTRAGLVDRVGGRLGAGAASTAAAIERWIEERRYDAATVAGEAALHLAEGPDAPRTLRPRGPADSAALARAIQGIALGHGYLGVWILDGAGRTVSGTAGSEPTATERRAARETLAGGRPVLCDPQVLPDGSRAMCYAAGVAALGEVRADFAWPGHVLPFAVVLRSNPEGSLIPLVASGTSREGSERSRLIARVGSEIWLVASSLPGQPVRARFGTARSRIPWERAPALYREALGGTAARGRYVTPDGTPSIGGIQPVAGTSWAVIRRVDEAEIVAAHWRQIRTELLLLGVALAGAALAVTSTLRAERSRRHRAVAASEARLAATLRSSFDAVIAVDDDARIRFFNPAAERLLRRDAADALGAPATLIVPRRLRRFHAERFRKFLASPDGAMAVGGTPDHVGVRADGEEFAFEAIVSKGVADGRRLTTIVIRDVSERRRAEEERERTLSVLRATLESTADGILVVDLDGRVTAFNRRFLDIWGIPDGVVEIGEPDHAALREAARARHPDPEAFVARVRAIYADPEADSNDHVALADGRLLERVSKPQRIGDRVVGRVWSFRDVTERERATTRLRQAEKLAAVGQFVSGVAHELNNPLAAILLFSEGMLQDDRTTEDAETLALVRDQARRARAIVRDLLAFVRGANGETTTVPAGELVEHATRALGRQLAAEATRIELEVRGDLGVVQVDRPAIEQVLTNLVLNAAQAAPRRPVRVIASVVKGADGDEIEVAVEDEGPGIPEEILSRVFEPFFTTKPVGVGTGLGLSVSLGIAQRHGGTLRAENRGGRAGRGARLVLTLPLATGRETTPTADAAETPLPLATRPRVLLVDDELPVRRALRKFFVRREWEVEEAEHGQAALDRLLASDAAPTYDLIISDLRMPGISGVALHDRIAAERPDLLGRFVISTGDVVSADAAAFVARTRCAVLEKPFELHALDAMVRRVLAGA